MKKAKKLPNEKMTKWQKGNLKLEGSNFLIVKLKAFWVLTTKSRHFNVYHKFLKYSITILIILGIILTLFYLHLYVFFPDDEPQNNNTKVEQNIN